VEALRDRFEARFATADRAPEEVLIEELGIEPDVDAFWVKVSTNLQIGRGMLLLSVDSHRNSGISPNANRCRRTTQSALPPIRDGRTSR
jgi:hypothetical protein